MSDSARRRFQLQLVESLEAQQEVEWLRELDLELGQKEELIRVPPMSPALRSVIAEVYGSEPTTATWTLPAFLMGLLSRPRPLAAGLLAVVFVGFGVHAMHRGPASGGDAAQVAIVSSPTAAAKEIPIPKAEVKPKEVPLFKEKVHPDDITKLSRLLWDKKINHSYRDGQIFVKPEDVESALLALNTNEQHMMAMSELKAEKVEPSAGFDTSSQNRQAAGGSAEPAPVQRDARPQPPALAVPRAARPQIAEAPPAPRAARPQSAKAPAAQKAARAQSEAPRAQRAARPEPASVPLQRAARPEPAAAPVRQKDVGVQASAPRSTRPPAPSSVAQRDHYAHSSQVVTSSAVPKLHSSALRNDTPAPPPRPVSTLARAVAPRPVAMAHHVATKPPAPRQNHVPSDQLALDTRNELAKTSPYNSPRQQQSVAMQSKVEGYASRPKPPHQDDATKPPEPREVAISPSQPGAPASNAAVEPARREPVPSEVHLPLKAAQPALGEDEAPPVRARAVAPIAPVQTHSAAFETAKADGLKPVPQWSERDKAKKQAAASQKTAAPGLAANGFISAGARPVPAPSAVTMQRSGTLSAGAVSAGDGPVKKPATEVAMLTEAKKLVIESVGEAEVLLERRDDGSLMVTVKPQRALNQSETEQLRKVLRKKLKLDDADSVVIRQP